MGILYELNASNFDEFKILKQMATSRSAALNYLWLQIRTPQTKTRNNILHETLEISEYVVRHGVKCEIYAFLGSSEKCDNTDIYI